MKPTECYFWFRMSLASIGGGVLAFPINAWLVDRKLKHGCMTLPGADGAPAAKLGHAAPEPSMVMNHGGHDMAEMEDGEHTMGSISFGAQFAWVVATFTLVVAATYITHFFTPISF